MAERPRQITQERCCYLMTLLVQGAHYILGPFGQDSDLRRWGLKLAEQGGKNAKKRAVVAVARKLSVLLHKLWVSGEAYEPLRNNHPSQHVRQLPVTLRRSLTWDRGLEMAQHKAFTMATVVQVYFCDPQSPWQRGSNENTNGLLRQYIPKKSDLSQFTQSDLDEIALRLNQRPRKTLGFQTPADKLQASVASTH